MSKLFIYDLETTGVQHWTHGTHQIAFMILIDGECKGVFDYRVKPFPQDEIDQDALVFQNISEEQIMAYPEPQEVLLSLKSVLSKFVDPYDKQDKLYLVGYNNMAFDNHFFRAFFQKNNDPYYGSWFWSNTIDVMVLASQKLMHKRSQMENFKLKTVAKEFGIAVDEDKLHNALYDLELIRQIYEYCLL